MGRVNPPSFEVYFHDYILYVTTVICYGCLAMQLTLTFSLVYGYCSQLLRALVPTISYQYHVGCSLLTSEAERLPAVYPFSFFEVLP